MKYLLLSILVFSMAAVSAEKKIAQATAKKTAHVKEQSLDVDPKDKTQEIADKTGLYIKSPDVEANVLCKDNDHELKVGDKGYEECLKKQKTEVKVEFNK